MKRDKAEKSGRSELVRELDPIIIGKRYTDIVTGVSGVVTAKHIYMFGCVRYTMEWGKDGKGEADVYDEQRLVNERNEKPLATARTGGDRPAVPALSTGGRR